MKLTLCFQDRAFILDVNPLSTVKELYILVEMVIDYYVGIQVVADDFSLSPLPMNGTLNENGVNEGTVIKLTHCKIDYKTEPFAETLSIEKMIHKLIEQLGIVPDTLTDYPIFKSPKPPQALCKRIAIEYQSQKDECKM
jgi:hypothetical protein